MCFRGIFYDWFRMKKELYNLRNGYLKYNPYFEYEEIDIYKFFDLIFSRNDELPFEECDGLLEIIKIINIMLL